MNIKMVNAMKAIVMKHADGVENRLITEIPKHEINSDEFLQKVGNKVFGMVNFPGHGNAYTEFAAAPTSQLTLMSRNFSFQDAATTTLAALTELQALEGRVKKGNKKQCW